MDLFVSILEIHSMTVGKSVFLTCPFYYSLEEKLSNLEDENHVLRQKVFSASPKSRHGFAKQFSDVCYRTLQSKR